MMANVVLHSPQKHERPHEQDGTAIWTKHPAHFAQTGNIIIEMLHDIKSGDQIERRISEGQTLRRTLLYFIQSARPAEVEGFSGNVNSFGRAELRQHLKIGAGAATHIQNPRPLFPEIPADSLDKLGDDAPPAHEPPVFALDLVHDRVGVLRHLAREGIGYAVCVNGHSVAAAVPPD